MWQHVLALVIGTALAVVIATASLYYAFGLDRMADDGPRGATLPVEIEVQFPPLGSARHVNMRAGQPIVIEDPVGLKGRVACVFIGWTDEQQSRARLVGCRNATE